MSWALINEEITFDDKVLEAGNAAFGAWVRIVCWVHRRETDGRVPSWIVRAVASKAETAKLIAARLLEPTEEGFFEIHDGLEPDLFAADQG